MADLDYRIILGSRPLESPAEMQDRRTARQIQQQEVELRRQEILARRDALREQAAARNRPKEITPAERKAALEYGVFRAEVVADRLKRAKENPALYPYTRQWIADTVGDASELPEQFDPQAIDAIIATGEKHIAEQKGTLQKIETVDPATGQPVQRFVAPKEGDTFPVVPKAATQNAPNVGSFEDYVLRTYGENPTSAQVLKARKEFNQADDRPAVTVRMGNGMTPGQMFDAERQLRTEFNRETKAAQTVQQQLSLMKASLDAVKKGAAPAGSQGVLVTFQKILDPTSVVRESEYARSASGMSLLSQIEGKWSQIQSGGAGVTAKDLEQFVTLAEQFALRQKAFADQTRAQIDQSAKDFGLDPARITRDIGAPVTTAPAGGTTTTEGASSDSKGGGEWVDAGNGIRIRKKQ